MEGVTDLTVGSIPVNNPVTGDIPKGLDIRSSDATAAGASLINLKLHLEQVILMLFLSLETVNLKLFALELLFLTKVFPL